MPHAIEVEVSQPTPVARLPKIKGSPPKEIRQLHALYNSAQEKYLSSSLSLSITCLLETKTLPKVTKVVSLGLGSFKSRDRSRRLKQLAVFLDIASHLLRNQPTLRLYAQDPSFTKTDQTFLQSLGIQIISTPSATETGEAAEVIDEETLVYSPFLTLEAYQLFFETGRLGFFVGDDFGGLRRKWPKLSTSWREAEALERRFVKGLRKRNVGSGEDFWEEGDKSFPMAMYDIPKGPQQRARL